MGNIDWLRELTKIAVNQRKNRKEMASNRSICACPMTFLFNVDGVSRCAAHTDKNRYALDFSGIVYRRFLLRFLTLPGPSCSKLTTSLVNVSLKFQTLILQIHCYFFCSAKDSHIFSTKNNSVFVNLADICLKNLCINDIVKLTML